MKDKEPKRRNRYEMLPFEDLGVCGNAFGRGELGLEANDGEFAAEPSHWLKI